MIDQEQMESWFKRFLTNEQFHITDPKWIQILIKCSIARALEREAAGLNTLWDDRPGQVLTAIESWLDNPTPDNKDKWTEAFSLMPLQRFGIPSSASV